MPSQRSTLTWNIVAALLLTIGVTMLTDFIHRMLGADPDSLGIFSIAVQALCAVAASSAFTRTGWSWLETVLGPLDKDAHKKALWRFRLALALLLLVYPLWLFLPPVLAQHYNTRGFNLRNTDPAEAMRNYERAIALDPQLRYPYPNLGEILEGFYRYDDAAEEYRKAIVTDHTDTTPYNNLARVLLLGGNAMTALQITDDALRLNPTDATTLAALHKNRAWAEYQLGFYQQAVAEASLSNTAAAACILGKAFAKLNRPADALAAWTRFQQLNASPATSQQTFEPDCTLLEENALEAK